MVVFHQFVACEDLNKEGRNRLLITVGTIVRNRFIDIDSVLLENRLDGETAFYEGDP